MRRLTLNGRLVLGRKPVEVPALMKQYNEESVKLAKVNTSIPGCAEFRFRVLAVKLAEKCVREHWVTHLRLLSGQDEAFRVEWWCQ